MQKKNSKDL